MIFNKGKVCEFIEFNPKETLKKNKKYRKIAMENITPKYKFIEKYNSANEKTKVGLNIQKVFDAINNEDYEYVYNKLDNTFKQTNFKTVQEFANYAVQNFAGKQLKYGECQQQGSMYIFDITMISGTNQINKRVIMQLKDGTDFVMSFNK